MRASWAEGEAVGFEFGFGLAEGEDDWVPAVGMMFDRCVGA